MIVEKSPNDQDNGMEVRYPDIDLKEGFHQCGSTPGKQLAKGSREGE